MKITKENLQNDIEIQRKKLNESIDENEDYDKILIISQKLDKLIEQYIVMNY